jgi:plastocyanin
VVVGNNSFSPSAMTVAKGTTVTWTWDQYSTNHNVKFDDGPGSQTMSSGSYTRTFSAAGTFPYHCEVHGQSMSGTITVQ